VAIVSFFLFFVALGLIERAAKFNASGERRFSRTLQQGKALALVGKYAEAAEFYTRQAQKELKNNAMLSFAFYCKHAFQMWVKAKEPRKALQEAGNVVSVYVMYDGRWMKQNSGDDVEKLTSMVSDLFGADYIAEGAFLAGAINKELEKFGLPMRCAAVPVRKNVFPASCTDCGANFFSNPYQDIARCDYCKAVIYPLNPTPEVKDTEAETARKANIIAVNVAADAANRSVTAERRIILPPAKPIEKGSRQTSYANNLSFTIPPNWERSSTEVNEQWDDFCSPDRKIVFGLTVNIIREKEGDMMHEFNKIIVEKPEAKVSLKVLDGDTLGIFVLSERNKINFKMNSITWESFSPPNSKGETNVLEVSMLFPAEEFELHKQLISDIYGSFKIRK